MSVAESRAVREAAAACGGSPDAVVDRGLEPWPFDDARARSAAGRLRARQLAALGELERIARLAEPDPDGWTAADYLHDLRDPAAEAGR